MKPITIIILAAACLSLPGCITITASYDIPDPNGGKNPVGHIGISHTWAPKPALPQTPGGKTPVLFQK